MNDNSSAPSLKITITPGTVYVSNNSSQSSYADLTITVKNISGGTLTISSAAITLPAELAPVNSLGSIEAVAGQPALWNFQASLFTAGEFDASPVSGSGVAMNNGDEWTFTLSQVTLVSTIAQTPQDVIASVTFSDNSIFSENLPVNLLKTTAGIASFTATRSNINPGEISILSWQCVEMDYCILEPGASTHVSTQDSLNVSPPSTTVYTLYAYGDAVILSAQYTISVADAVIVSFGVEGQANVDLGGYITLNWTCNEFTNSIKIDASTAVTIPDNIPVKQRAITLGPINAPTTFTLYAYGTNNYTTAGATVSINDLTATLTATPSSGLWVQDEVTLSWDITNATAVSLSPGLPKGGPSPSLQNLSGSVGVRPAAGVTTLAYTLTATGFINDIEQTIYPGVDLTLEPVSITNFAVSPTLIAPLSDPNQAELTWTTQAQQVTINNGIGAVAATSSVQVNSPPNGAVYVLSAGTIQNPVIASRQIQVTNAYGPYNFNSFYQYSPSPGGDPFTQYIILPVENLMQMDLYLPDQLTITIAGAVVDGQPVTQPIQADIANVEPYGIGFSLQIRYSFEWEDPNNPSGVIWVT